MNAVIRQTSPLYVIIVFLALNMTSAAMAQPSAEQTQRAKALLRLFDDMWRGQSSHAILTMQIKTAHYTRNMKMEAWSKGKDKTLVRIQSPLKEKGTATLKSGNDIYTYLPHTDRTIKLTSGMMMGSWMGSHFTNDDLVKESRMEEDYDPVISFEGERDGQNIIEFTLIPKPDAVVVWGKIILTTLADHNIPVQSLYYDEDMVVARTMQFSAVKTLADKPRPSVMRIIPADKPNEYTELDYLDLNLDIDINDAFFSLANLKRR